MGKFPWRHNIKLDQGAFGGNPPVSLVPPVSLLVGFPGLEEGLPSKRTRGSNPHTTNLNHQLRLRVT